MPTKSSLRRFSKTFLIAGVAVATLSMSTVALAGGAGAVTKSTKAERSAKAAKVKKSANKVKKSDTKVKKSDTKIVVTPAIHAAVRAYEIRKADDYVCANAHQWLRYEKSLSVRYTKRLANLRKWKTEAGNARDLRKVTGLTFDIDRVEARQAANVQARPVLKHDSHAEAMRRWCETKGAWSEHRSHGAKDKRTKAEIKAARAKMRAAEGRAAEIKAAQGQGGEGQGGQGQGGQGQDGQDGDEAHHADHDEAHHADHHEAHHHHQSEHAHHHDAHHHDAHHLAEQPDFDIGAASLLLAGLGRGVWGAWYCRPLALVGPRPSVISRPGGRVQSVGRSSTSE